MARRGRRYHRHKRGLLPKTIGGWAGFVLKTVGVVTVAAPAIKGVTDGWSNPANIPNLIVYNYSGFSPTTGQFNAAQTGVGIGTVAAGGLLIYLGKVFSRMVR